MTTFIIVAILVGLCLLGLSVGVIIKGKFPETHVGENEAMRKLGIRCAKEDCSLPHGLQNDKGCEGCALMSRCEKVGG